MPLLDRIRQTIRRHSLADPDARVVVALSGGSDSVALAHLLRLLDAAGELHVVGVAHFNHQIRSAAAEDEAFCAALSAKLNWPFFADRDDVTGRARRERRSIEHAARRARHEFFDRARTHFSADRVAVGHTRDDQAETYLLRVLRGAGPQGLAGMHPRRDFLVRPLLECRRDELRAFLTAEGCTWREDESNADISIPRNRIRAELLPILEQRFNPGIVDVLADQAEIARVDWAHLDHEAETLTWDPLESTCRHASLSIL